MVKFEIVLVTCLKHLHELSILLFFNTAPSFDSLHFLGPMITKKSCTEFKRMCPLTKFMDEKQFQREVMPYVPKPKVKKSFQYLFLKM